MFDPAQRRNERRLMRLRQRAKGIEQRRRHAKLMPGDWDDETKFAGQSPYDRWKDFDKDNPHFRNLENLRRFEAGSNDFLEI